MINMNKLEYIYIKVICRSLFLTQEVKQKPTIIRAAMHFEEQGKNNIKTYREVFSQGQTNARIGYKYL